MQTEAQLSGFQSKKFKGLGAWFLGHLYFALKLAHIRRMVCLPLAQFYHHYEVKMKLAALNLGVGKVPYLPLERAAKNWREMKSSL